MEHLDILVVGDMGCGKSILIDNFINGAADLAHHAVDWQQLQQWSVDYGSTSLKITELSHGQTKHTKAIFELSGLKLKIPKKIRAILYVFDIGNKRSFQNVFLRHMPFIENLIGKKVLSILVATHGFQNCEVDRYYQEKAQSHRLPLFVSDGQTSLGCSSPFEFLVRHLNKKHRDAVAVKAYPPTIKHFKMLEQINQYGNYDMLPDDKTVFPFGSPYFTWFAEQPISAYFK